MGEKSKVMAESRTLSYGSIALLQPLQKWLNNSRVSEVMLNTQGEIWIEQGSNLTKHKVPELNSRHLACLFQLLANENKQRISLKNPLLSGSLPDGSRIQLCLPPTAKDYCFAIRRQVTKDLSLEDYDNNLFYHKAYQASIDPNLSAIKTAQKDNPDNKLVRLYKTKNWPEFIKLAISLRKNIVISGGTSSGKTTYLNACIKAIPKDQRLILLEDTRELKIPHDNYVSLLASKGEQGRANITMQDLIQCALRLRPDRIIMGEIRGKEIMDFVSACSTGHDGALTSIHANCPAGAFMRMVQMYKLNCVPSMRDEEILAQLYACKHYLINKPRRGVQHLLRWIKKLQGLIKREVVNGKTICIGIIYFGGVGLCE